MMSCSRALASRLRTLRSCAGTQTGERDDDLRSTRISSLTLVAPDGLCDRPVTSAAQECFAGNRSSA